MNNPGERGQVNIDLDSFTPATQQRLREELAQISSVPMFEGTIEHAYTLARVGQKERCPRCGAPTQWKTANFVYATDIAPRAMLAPAGYFCSACPTVIIDEGLIESGMKKGFAFRGVVAIDHDNGKRLDIFKTWNGEKPVYILDENEQFAGLASGSSLQRPPPPPPSQSARRDKERRKKKLADKARRRNRR
jgi:hypothetical protein